jgi:hypothetical protein
MSSEASVHLKASTPVPPSAGSTESNAQPVAAMKTRWKMSAAIPMPSSAAA